MAENITTLGIEVKTSGVQQAASDLQKLASSAKSTEQSTSGMTSALDRVNAQIKAMGDKAKGASNAAQSAWRNIESGIKPVEQAVQKVANSFDKAAKSAEGFGSASASVAKGGVAAFAIIKAWEMVAANIGKAIEAADEYARIESRLRQISGGASGAVELQKELYTVAQESRQSFTELANTYAQVARATQDLGVSQSELLNITKTVSQAVSLSGSSTQAAQAAMVQFSQAMASGTLRGEKLNSIMEQTPRLAQAIANGLGIGIGELLRLGAQGELTAKQVLGAIAKSASDIDREFKSMTPTVEDGFTKLANSGKNFIDVLSDATGASKLLYRTLNALSGAMDFTAQGIKTGVQNAKTGVIEAEISRLKNQIGSLGKDDFRLSGLKSQLDAKQADLYKSRGTGLAGGAEMPVLPGSAKQGQSADYVKTWEKLNGISSDYSKNLRIIEQEYARTGNLKQYQAEVQKLIETETQIGKDSIKKPRTGGGGGKTAAAQASEEAKAYADAMKGFADIAANADKATLDLNASQSKLYDLMTSPGWATASEALKKTAVAEFELAYAAEKNAEAHNKMAKAMEEGKKIAEEMRTPEEALGAEIIRLNALLASGALDWENYARKMFATQDAYDAVKNKAAETGNTMSEFAISAARNIQSSMADFLFDPFKDGMDGMLRSFVDVIRRMAAEAIAAQIAKKLFGDMNAKGGGDGGLVGLAFTAFTKAAGFHEGGIVGDGNETFNRMVPIETFAKAKRYHSGGLVGDEVPAILQKGEMVLTKEQQKQAGQSSGQNIRIINAFDNGVIGDYLGSSAGEKLILNAVQRNASAFKQAVA